MRLRRVASCAALALCVCCVEGTEPSAPSPASGAETADTQEQSARAAQQAAAWARTCAEPFATRLESQRVLAREEARASADASAFAALERWHPRGREGGPRTLDAQTDRPAIVTVVRRGLRTCGLADAISLTTDLVRFQTVVAAAAPDVNPEHARMAQYLSDYAAQAGLSFRVFGASDAWEVELPGASPERALAFVFHADIVAVGDPPAVIPVDAVPSGWSAAPFTAHVEEGRLYGRGTEDDKGPIAAGLIVMATLANAGLTPRESIVLAIGTAEEEDWDGMRRYAEAVPHARHVVSVDSNFPVVAAESGFVAWGVQLPVDMAPRRGTARASTLPRFVEPRGGLFLTQVPDRAEVILVSPSGAGEEEGQSLARAVRASIDAVLSHRRADGFDASFQLTTHEGRPAVRLVATGRSAHSSVAEEGANAIWLLAAIAAHLGQSTPVMDDGVARMLAIISAHFDGDHHGERLGLRYEDALMGSLLVAPTLLRLHDGIVELGVNMRRPRGMDADAFRVRLGAALETMRALGGAQLRAIDDVYVGEPHVADTGSALVPTLMELWRAQTGREDAEPISIRGGTYARLFPGAVDFGPSIPGRPYTGHGADEYIELEALELTVQLLFESALRLSP